MVKVTVPTMTALQALCASYLDLEPQSGGEQAPTPAQPEHVMTQAASQSDLVWSAGTGKTYATINAALEILDAPFLAANANNRQALRKRFSELEKDRRVRFTTFHQSFSYEDFVEGIRATVGTEADANPTGVELHDRTGYFRGPLPSCAAQQGARGRDRHPGGGDDLEGVHRGGRHGGRDTPILS